MKVDKTHLMQLFFSSFERKRDASIIN
ncbi:hypothetical protein ACQ27_gp457 [Klebsiella phage K64-1]|nr:hypothetical protein ACQ27_gp457 [Klebsiella phage K64-1]